MRKAVAWLLAAGLLISAGMPVQAADIGTNHRFYDEMMYLEDEGIMSGFPDGTYRPDETVTRAQAAILIGRMLGYEGGQQQTPFPDVYPSMKASGYIAQGAEAGIITGYSDGTFRPDAAVTRGDMAIFLARAAELPQFAEPKFSDVGPNMKAYESISKILSGFITAGYPDGTFRPEKAITRGEFSAFLARTLEPAFKNDARMAGSYVRDMTRTYTFNNAGVTAVHTFEHVPPLGDELPVGFAWQVRASDGMNVVYYLYEDRDGLMMGQPYADGYTHLSYPVREGRTFTVYNEGVPATYTYSSVGGVVETPYGTFTDAVEVTRDDGSRYYYVPDFGNVKIIGADGKVESELVDVE